MVCHGQCTGNDGSDLKSVLFSITIPEPTQTCTSWTYSDWTACQSDGTQARTIATSSPAGCAGGSPVLTRTCTYTPEAVPGCTDSAAFNYNPSANTDDGSCVAVVTGCTSAVAFNYNPLANTDDGSCIAKIYGCTDGAAFNYNQSANTDDGSCIAVVRGCTSDTAFNYNPSANTDDGSCVPVVSDCTDPAAFNYNPSANTDDGSCVAVVTGCTSDIAFNFNPSANTDDGSCVAVVRGCTDNTAFNYNQSANTDDGSCVAVVRGCTSEIAFNYNSSANTDDGSCVAVIRGCTDNTAFNYNQSANTDDGSCVAVVRGCTSETATNYNPSANTDDESCTYPSESVPGCMNSTATNYNQSATVDDGSCTYPPTSTTCTSWTYSDWTACQSDGTQTRTIATSSPTGCSGGEVGALTQNCTYIPPTETYDACSNLEGNQEAVPQGYTAAEGVCTPTQTTGGETGGDTSGGGGSPGNFWAFGGAMGFAPQGVVKGVTDVAEDEGSIEEDGMCTPYLKSYLRIGRNNKTDEVKKLQGFLNEFLGLNIPLTGIFGPKTFAAVTQLQSGNWGEILAPWGLSGDMPTGYVYKTTKRFINNMKCPKTPEPMPDLSN